MLSSSRVFGGLLIVSALGAGCGSSFEAGPNGPAGSSGASGAGGAAASSGVGTGGAGGGTTSASSTGAGGEGGMTAAPPTSCTVLVHDGSDLPVADMPVAINDASGAVVAVAKTAADGKVTVSVPAGGMVTAFDSEGTASSATSALAPPDGSTFFVQAQRNYPPAQPQAQSTSYHVVATGSPPGTADFLVVTSCTYQAFAPAQMAVILPGGCAGGATETIVMIARDASGKSLGWAATNKQTAAGKDGGYVYLVPTLPQFDTFDAAITSIPFAASSAEVDISPWGNTGLKFPFLGKTAKGATTLSAQTAVPPGFTSGLMVTEVVYYAANNTSDSTISRSRRFDAAAGSDALDPTHYVAVTLDGLDLADPTHPQVSWSAGTGDRGDRGIFTLAWAGAGGATAAWQISFPTMAPPALRMPDVPAGLESFAPKATSTIGYWSVCYHDDENVGSYAESLGPAPMWSSGHGWMWSTAEAYP
jgi:hypothetical protein